MSTDNPKSEFRRYRHALAITYLTVAGAGLLWLAASVVYSLSGGDTASAMTANTGDCTGDAAALLRQLEARASAELSPGQLESHKDGIGQTAEIPIETFFADWHASQRALETRCSPDSDTGSAATAAGPARALRSVGLGYQNLLVRYQRDHATAARALRRALDENANRGGKQ